MRIADLRWLIAMDHRAVLRCKERVRLLMLEDGVLLRMQQQVEAGAARNMSCAQIANELIGWCTYDQLKLLMRAQQLLKRRPPPRNEAHRTQARDMLGHFVTGDEYEAPIDRGALRRRWLAEGVAPETADRWLDEMGAG